MKLIDKVLQFLKLQNPPLEGKELEEYQKQFSELLNSQGTKDVESKEVKTV
jgi:hypothetical protein